MSGAGAAVAMAAAGADSLTRDTKDAKGQSQSQSQSQIGTPVTILSLYHHEKAKFDAVQKKLDEDFAKAYDTISLLQKRREQLVKVGEKLNAFTMTFSDAKLQSPNLASFAYDAYAAVIKMAMTQIP